MALSSSPVSLRISADQDELEKLNRFQFFRTPSGVAPGGKGTEHAVLRRACRVACRVAEHALWRRRVPPCGAVRSRVAPCAMLGDVAWCRIAPCGVVWRRVAS
eukprot:gene9107-biopygen3394